MQDNKLTTIQRRLLDELKASNGQPVTRGTLQYALFDVRSSNNDRAVRKTIENLRNLGYVIVSYSDGSGYKLATTEDEVRHYVAEQVKRAKTLLRTARKVKAAYGLRDQLPFAQVLS